MERSFSDTEYASSLYRQLLFLEFMIQLNRAALKNRLDYLGDALYNKKVVDIMHYINEHLDTSLDIDLLASKFYISRYYMMRLFKSETGYTIHNYIAYKRLLLARELISQGTPITQACFDSGFPNYSTFSRAYKAEFGVSARNHLQS